MRGMKMKRPGSVADSLPLHEYFLVEPWKILVDRPQDLFLSFLECRDDGSYEDAP